MPENFEKASLSAEVQSALDFIGMMRQECAQLGANDAEFDLLDQLRQALKNGEIDPSQAREQAAAIRHNKADYH